jgi:uncharacterized protein (DUF4415 family)
VVETFLTVACTDRSKASGGIERRIISARLSNRRERMVGEAAARKSTPGVGGRGPVCARRRMLKSCDVAAGTRRSRASGSCTLTVPVRSRQFGRVDADVLEWFKQAGLRYQSRMNAVLRSFMQASTVGIRKSGKR